MAQPQPRGQDAVWAWGQGVRLVTLQPWLVPSPRRWGGMSSWGHESQGTREVACPTPGGTGQGAGDGGEEHKARDHPWHVWDGVLLGTGDRDERPGDVSHLQPVGDRVGRGAEDLGGAGWGRSRGPELTWDLRIRRSAEDRASSCSMFLSMPGENRTPARQGPSPPSPPAVPVSPRGRGDWGTPVAGWGGRGHSLFSLLRTLLAIFLMSAVSCSRSSLVSVGWGDVSRGSHRGNVPRKGTRDPRRGGTLTLLGDGGREDDAVELLGLLHVL